MNFQGLSANMNVVILCWFVFILLLSSTIPTEVTSTEELSPIQVLDQCLISRFSKCYSLFDNNPVNYVAAKLTCQQHGGKLASVPDRSTQQFINFKFVKETNKAKCNREYSYLHYCTIWFDLFTKRRHSKDFFTSGGTLTNFTNWNLNLNQPDLNSRGSGDETYCGAFHAVDGFWNDESCRYDKQYFLCEREGTPCNVNEIQVSNIIFDSCHKNKLVPMNTLIIVRCEDGYITSENPIVFCGRNGTWTKPPTCYKVCSQPILSSHSQMPYSDVKDFYDVGNSIIITCDLGYVSGTDRTRSHFVITCSEKGDWENVLKCVPLNKFQVITKGVVLGGEIKLDCHLPNGSLVFDNWLWQKNSLAINPQDGYTTNANGSLLISSFQSIHEGVYTCISLSSHITVGSVSYYLQPKVSCLNISDSYINGKGMEGSSLLINCPHSGIKGSTKLVTWLKDGQPQVSSDRMDVLPDGSLVIFKALYSDKGQYSCNVSWNLGLCSARIFIDVTVEASAESICGNHDMSMSPWTVSLYLEDEHSPFCYGAIIHNQWIVTSAHCMLSFSRKRSSKLFVLFGQELLVDNVDILDSNKIRHVESINIHPKYSPRLFANDVALVKLRERITFSDDVQPICLTDKNLTESRPCASNRVVHGVISGWGQLNKHDPTEAKFLIENMSVMNVNLCNVTAAASAVKHTDAICAIPTTSEAPNYAGNVGSPLVVEYESRVYLLGIFMLGERYTLSGNNDYFTNIPNYYSWIKTILV